MILADILANPTQVMVIYVVYNELFHMQDDDSDLEYELEAFPEVSSEASTEAAACVKVQ